MDNTPIDVLIIGAGLTGLTLAYLLKKQKVSASVKLIEARDRIGGRIHTSYLQGQAPQEMGATWLGKKHKALINLLEELGIEQFAQKLGTHAIYEAISTSPHQLVQLPPNDEPSYRIKGGTATLINALAQSLDSDQIILSQIVKSIELHGERLEVISDKKRFVAKKVIATLPPNLFVQSIDIRPRLPAELLQIAKSTHIWMGESIKISLSYQQAFWRAPGFSGTIVSNVGPIPEMYDHADSENKYFALKGFLNSSYFSLKKAERLELILRQLEKYYGDQVRSFLDYQETVWRKEVFTYATYENHILPHQNGGHPIYQQAFLDGKLYLSGSETSPAFPGYMEGAVKSAQYVFQQLL